jgi:hypothetical protein
VTGKIPTKNEKISTFFAYFFLKVLLHQSSKMESKKKSQKVKIKVFSDERFRIWNLTNTDESGSERPKTYGSGSITLKLVPVVIYLL